MTDDNSTGAAYGLIPYPRNEDRYASALQLARQLNASPTKRRMRSALTVFKALQAKPELVPIAVGGLAGIATLLALQPLTRRRKQVRQPEPHDKVAMPAGPRMEITQSVLWISVRTVQIERFPDDALIMRVVVSEGDQGGGL